MPAALLPIPLCSFPGKAAEGDSSPWLLASGFSWLSVAFRSISQTSRWKIFNLSLLLSVKHAFQIKIKKKI